MSYDTPFVGELAEFLAELGLGQKGSIDANGTLTGNIWIGNVPQEAVTAIWIVPAPSPAPEEYIAHQTTLVDFWCRSDNAAYVYQTMQRIYSELHRREQYQTTSWYIFSSFANDQPQDAGFDDEHGRLQRLGVKFLCYNMGLIS